MKYITYPRDGGPVPAMLLFPDYLTHREVATGKTVLSAGFVDMEGLRCHGSSVTLNVGSTPGDTALLRMLVDHAPERQRA